MGAWGFGPTEVMARREATVGGQQEGGAGATACPGSSEHRHYTHEADPRSTYITPMRLILGAPTIHP
eukprot:scaffold16051_cov111-Isochrysis_galbana.AAC.4